MGKLVISEQDIFFDNLFEYGIAQELSDGESSNKKFYIVENCPNDKEINIVSLIKQEFENENKSKSAKEKKVFNPSNDIIIYIPTVTTSIRRIEGSFKNVNGKSVAEQRIFFKVANRFGLPKTARGQITAKSSAGETSSNNIIGNEAGEVIVATENSDSFYCGGGDDVYIYNSKTWGNDTITDWLGNNKLIFVTTFASNFDSPSPTSFAIEKQISVTQKIKNTKGFKEKVEERIESLVIRAPDINNSITIYNFFGTANKGQFSFEYIENKVTKKYELVGNDKGGYKLAAIVK